MFKSQDDMMATRRTEVFETTQFCVKCAAEWIVIEMELACQDLEKSWQIRATQDLSKMME